MEEKINYLELLEKSNFQKRLNHLKKKFKNKKVVLYGVGQFFEAIKDNYDLSDLNIIGVSDLKFRFDGEDFLGYKTIKFENITSYNPDVIIVSTLNYEPIINNFKNFYFANLNIKIDSLYKKLIIDEIMYFLPKPKISKEEKYRQEIENLKSIVNNYIDIKNLPKANGKLREFQLSSLEILDTVNEICQKNNLNYWLDSGTLLGAYRHKGYVPWDDDIDICMPREDYNKIFPLLEVQYKDSDFYIRKRAIECNYYQTRIISRYNPKIALDIFPVDSYFKSNLSEEEKNIADKSIKKAREIFARKYPQVYVAINKIDDIHQDMMKIQNKIVMNNNKPAENEPALFFAIDFPYRTKKHLIFDYSTIFPLKTMEFEGRNLSVPNDTHEYLSNLYGEFMGFPSGVLYSKEEGFRQNMVRERRK